MLDTRKDVLAVIPCRWGSTRFPGKPLARVAGRPLVRWVWEAAAGAKRVTRVVVATDHARIASEVRRFGGEAVLTSARCQSGTDRVAEVARGSRAGLIVNIQGDEPLLSAAVIDEAIAALQEDSSAVLSTAVRKLEDEKEWRDPNVVKVVIDRLNYALYFSRSAIPWQAAGSRGRPTAPRWVHVGLYAYRRPFLFRFAALPPSTLEASERLEQLRVLEHGCPIKVVIAPSVSYAVDRPEDVRKVERILDKRGIRTK